MSIPAWFAVLVPVLAVAGVAAVLWSFGPLRFSDAVLAGLPLAGVAGLAGGVFAGLSPSHALSVGVPLALVASFGVVRFLDRPGGRWMRRLRSRLLFGVPWGTLVAVAGVLADYLLLQGGLWHLYRPLTIPFTSWSYLYPLGLLAAPFSHMGLGHLTGNLVGTLAFAPLAEYAWSHFPTERGESAFGSWRTNPYVRAFALFPLGVLLVGLCTSLFSWGPVIGFSGVVYAFAGLALVRYPLTTLVAMVAEGTIATVYYTLRDPVVVASASPSYGPPWWAGIAIQGHVLGLFLGVVAGALLLSRREARPPAIRVWSAVFLFAVSQSLWLFWWYRGPQTYVLYRGLGVLFVLVVAALIATAVRARDRPLPGDVTPQQLGLVVLLLPVLAMAGVAVPINAATVAGGDLPGEEIHVRDYSLTYAEGVPNQRVGVVDVSVFNETTAVNASGVVVQNPDRHIWTEAVSTGYLAFAGTATVTVGGVGWSETIVVRREGWIPVGGEPVYHVRMRRVGEPWLLAFQSDPSTADPVVAGRNVTIAATNGTFRLRVTRNDETLGWAPIPTNNSSVRAGGLTFVRNETRILAVRNETRVQVAKEETYE